MLLALIGGYAFIGILILRPIAGHYAWQMAKNSSYRTEPNGDDWFGSYLIAVLLAVIWPVVVISLLTSHVSVGAEKQARLEAAERRVTQLERELDL